MKYAKKKQLKAVLTLAVLGYLAAPVYGEAAVEQTRDVMITATRTAQEIKETPVAAQVITREEIETMGAENVAQILKLATGIDSMQNGMVGHTVSIRGMNTNQTLILVDGRRIRTEDTSSTANAYELDRFNVDTIERIEIVRGPASSLYGSEALGGVINIITRKSSTPQTTVALSSTSQEKAASVRADFGKQGKWSWTMNARTTDVKENSTGTGTKYATNQYGDRNYFGIDGSMDISDQKKLDIYVDVLEENLDSKGFKSSMQPGVGVTYAPKKENYDNKRISYGVTYHGQDSYGDYELRAYQTDFTKRLMQRNTDTQQLLSFDDMEFNSRIIDGKRSLQVGENHLLTVGGEYRNEIYEGTRIGTSDKSHDVTVEGVTKKSSESNMDFAAVYLQDEWLVNDKLLVIPSIRYDHNNKFGGEVTAKVGTTYKFNNNYRLKANIGSAYKAPSASELYMSWQHSPSVITVNVTGNPDLQPEKSLNYELSLEGERGKNFGKLTYFRNDVDDLITQTSLGNVGMTYYYTYKNVAEATIDGVEAEFGRKLSDKWTTKLSYVNLHAVDGNNKRIEGRANDRVTVQLAYDDSKNSGVSGVLWNEWIGDYLVSDTENYSYNTLNISLRKKFNNTVSGYVGLDNMLDKKIPSMHLDGRIWRAGVNFTI